MTAQFRGQSHLAKPAELHQIFLAIDKVGIQTTTVSVAFLLLTTNVRGGFPNGHRQISFSKGYLRPEIYFMGENDQKGCPRE